MKKVSSFHILKSVAAIFFVCLSLPFTSASSERTLARVEDFVVLSGKDVNSMIGAETGDLRLYSCNSGACSAIPLQVDKIDISGRYVFPQDTDAGRDSTKLDDNDELCFMASDAGDGTLGGWRPEAAARGVEIELRDPLDGGRGWVYLFDEPGSAAPVLPDYVSYKIEGDHTIIESEQFALGYRTGGVSYDYMRMFTPGGGLGADVLDRQRMGIEAVLASDLNMPFAIPENIVSTVDIGVIDGPVRVVVDEIVLVKIGELSFQWGTEYFFKGYRCGHHNSVSYESPVAAGGLFKSMIAYWSLDFSPEALGSYYVDQNGNAPYLIRDVDLKDAPNLKPHFWWGIYGDQGAFLQALYLDEGTEEHFICDGRWKQNRNPRVRRGDHPGRLEIGFDCHEREVMPDDSKFHASNYILFPKDPSLRGLNALENIFENPLKTSVTDLP
jgi:hypothetical protein